MRRIALTGRRPRVDTDTTVLVPLSAEHDEAGVWSVEPTDGAGGPAADWVH